MPDQTISTIIRYEADAGAANTSVKAADRIEQATTDIGKAAKRAASEQTALEQANTRAAKAASASFESQLRVVKDQADIYGDLASRTSAFSGLASSLGGSAFGGRLMIAADILDAVEATKLFSAEMPELAKRLTSGKLGLNALTVGLGAVGVALAAVTVGLILLSEAGKKSRQTVLAQIDAFNDLNELNVRTLNTQQINEQISAIEDEMAARAENIQAAKDHKIALRDSLNPFEQLADAVGVASYGMDDWIGTIDELEQAQERDRIKVEILRGSLDDTATAINDLDTAEKKLADTRGAYVQTHIEAEQEILERSRSWTSEQAKARLEEIDARRALIAEALKDLAPLAADSEDVQKQMTALGEEFGTLGTEAQRLNERILPVIEARERERKQAEVFKQTLDDVSAAFGEQMDLEKDLADIRKQAAEDAANLRADYSKDTAKTGAERERKRAEALEDFEYQRAEREATYLDQRAATIQASEERISTLRSEYETARVKAETAFRKEELQAQEDFNRAQERSADDHRLSIQDAALRLDASAIFSERRRYEQERTQAQEDFNRTLADRAQQHREQQQADEQAFQARLDAEQAALDKQIAQAQAAYKKQEAKQLEVLERQFAREDAANERQDAERKQQLNEQLTDLRTSGINQATERRAQYQEALTDLQTFHAQETALIKNHYSGLLGQLQQQASTSKTSTTTTTANRRVNASTIGALLGAPRFAAGGYMAGDGLARLENREFVLTPNTVNVMERGMGARLTQAGIQQMVNNRSIGNFQQTFNFAGGTTLTEAQIRRAAQDGAMDVLEALTPNG